MGQKLVESEVDTPHNVFVDRAGFGGHTRYTCQDCSPGGVSATCLRHPYMNTAQWEAALAEFKQAHPFTEAKRYPGE